jgi:hypothetical protein
MQWTCLLVAILIAATPPGEPVSPGGGTLTASEQTTGYVVTIRYAASDAVQGAAAATLRDRLPTRAESPLTPNGDGYFYFTMTLAAPQPVTFPQGATVDVVFPQALDSSLVYSLTLGFADKPIGPIVGTLQKNALHFVLPPFTAKPGVELMGEIDGDPANR